MRATLADLPAEKREKLLMEFSEDDVLVVGNDNVKAKPAKANSSTPKLNHQDSVALMNEASQISNTQKMSLQLSGFYAEDLAASNNWVVSGKRTVTGKPLLANDPHLALTVPSVWYMVHLSMPRMRVAGVTTPGFPGVLIGHNEHIAWGATNLGPDVQDLYLETFDTQNPNRYKTPNGWRDANVIREEIKVRKNPTTTETESEFFEVTETRHGPIILERDGKRYALQWTAFDPKSGEADTFFRFNYSRNWKDFTDALSIYKGVTFNFVYADVAGNIGYYGAGGIPIRKSGDGSTPYDGSTDDGEWIGYIPLKELPYLYNPPDGIIVTANQRVVGKSYKHFLSHLWASPYRAKRIKELLLAKPKHSAETFREIQADIFNRHLTTFTKEFLKLNGFDMPMNGTMAVLMGSSSELSKDDVNRNKTLSVLSGWDGRITANSKAAVLVSVIRVLFRQKILENLLGKERARGFGWSNEAVFFNWLIKTKPVEWLPSEYKDYLSLLKDCEKEARATLTQRFGADESKWIWSNFNPGRAIHPLSLAPLVGGQFAIEPFAINGGNNVPNVGAFVSMRFIADSSNWDATRQNIQLGQSGVPKSPHWKDQMQEWLNVSPRVFPFSQTAIEKAAKETWTLMPEK
jgi:penicillin amidase